MAAIGEIVTGSDIVSLQKFMRQNYASSGFVAPTVYRLAKVSNWNYYSSLNTALNQWGYLNKVKGFTQQKATGSIKFNTAATETMGVNVDFYFYFPLIGIINVPYVWVRTVWQKAGFNCIIRFYKTDGSGPFYAIVNNTYFGAAATVVNNVAPDKLAALDDFHRQVQLLKTKYNTLSSFLNSLSKQQVSARQQQIFNEGVLLLNNLQNQIKQIKGIEVKFGSTGQIGEPISLTVIIAIAILSAAAGWTINAIITEKEKTSRINESYDLQKWISQQNVKIQQDKTLSQAQKDALVKQNNSIALSVQKNAEQSSSPTEGIFDKIENILLIGFAAMLLFKLLPNNNH